MAISTTLGMCALAAATLGVVAAMASALPSQTTRSASARVASQPPEQTCCLMASPGETAPENMALVPGSSLMRRARIDQQEPHAIALEQSADLEEPPATGRDNPAANSSDARDARISRLQQQLRERDTEITRLRAQLAPPQTGLASATRGPVPATPDAASSAAIGGPSAVRPPATPDAASSAAIGGASASTPLATEDE